MYSITANTPLEQALARQSEAKEAFENAKDAEKEQKASLLDRALHAIKKSLEDDPENAQSLILKGDILWLQCSALPSGVERKEKLEEAKKEFELAREILIENSQ